MLFSTRPKRQVKQLLPKEDALLAKVKAEVVEINGDSDEAADKSSKPSANDATQTPASKPQEGSTPSPQQVDQRMNISMQRQIHRYL